MIAHPAGSVHSVLPDLGPAAAAHQTQPNGGQAQLRLLIAVQKLHKSFLERYVSYSHRRRIKTEEKTEVVAAAWRAEFIKFLAALAILPRTFLKNRMNSSFYFKSSWYNSSYYSNRAVQNS